MDIDALLSEIQRPPTPPSLLDLQSLTRAWISERVAPELLPYPTDLIARVSGRIRTQIELVEERTGSMEPRTNFGLVVVQTELERWKYLVRALLRCRIAKLDKHALHYLTNDAASRHLSAPERQYLEAHHALLSAHYQAAFLAQFPAALQRLDDTAGGISMVDVPDEHKAVFCRVLRDVGSVFVEGTDVAFEMARGDVYVVRWSVVRRGVLAGDVELI